MGRDLSVIEPCGPVAPHAERLRSFALPDGADRSDLVRLRISGLGCRAMAALRFPDQVDPLSRLVRMLPAALGRAPILYPAKAPMLSADESWLMAALTAARRKDRASLHFLLRRHVPGSWIWTMAAAVKALAEES